MDRLEALIAIAHLRLRLVVVEKYPHLLEGIEIVADATKKPPLKIRMPIELAGLKSRMIRADGQETAIKGLGKRYDAVQDGIDELVSAHTEHVGGLEHYEQDLRRKIEAMIGSNGGDPLDGGQDGQKSDGQGGGQVISSETET